MDQEKYKLNWHNYSDHLREMLHEIMQSKELTDVTLICDDKRQFKAHKIVLSACSSVFKSIITELPQNNSVIYLRGIQHQEMESILDFMYLGVATFYQERMNEFVNVAKCLEMKEISKAVDNYKIVSKEELEILDNEIEIEPELETKSDSSLKSEQLIDPSKIKRTSEGKFNCFQCESKFALKTNLIRHIESVHAIIKYDCAQCDYKCTRQDYLKIHIQSQHEGVRFACNQCDHQATRQDHLKSHIRSIHEEAKYTCNRCDYRARDQNKISRHIKNKH